MDGILLVDKPAGWTSFDVVAKVRGILRAAAADSKKIENDTSLPAANYQIPSTKIKVGHTGTLDPFATGLLILVLGSYCKRAGEFSGMSKTYKVTAILGQNSTTGDPEGELNKISDAQPSLEQINNALKSFTGVISQIPPSYSAIKVGGQRAYKLARAGKSVQIEPRRVTVHSIEDINYSYPTLSFTASVSSGTYIRSLVQDIGVKLGTGGYTAKLQRTSVGDYSLKGAVSLGEGLDASQIEQAILRP